MKLYIVFEGDEYDYKERLQHVFEEEEDAKTYIKTREENEGAMLYYREIETVSYHEKQPSYVYGHYVRYFYFEDGREPSLELKVIRQLDTDTSTYFSFYGKGNMMNFLIPFHEKKELNKEKTLLLINKIKNELSLEDKEQDENKEDRVAYFKQFKKEIFSMFQ